MTERRFALFGAGFWASYQLAAWGECPGVRCVAVCDPVLDRAELLARRHSVPRACGDAKEAYGENRLDFDTVATELGQQPHAARALWRVCVVSTRPSS
jgi:predicted dehydrogenase